MPASEPRDVTALATTAADGIREALESLDFSTDDERRAAIRRVLRGSSVGLDGDELRRLLDTLKEAFPDSAYEADIEQSRVSERLAEVESALAASRAEIERLKRAGASEADTARAMAEAVSRGAACDPGDLDTFRDAESVASIIMALTRFAVRQEEVSRAALKVVPGSASSSGDVTGTPLLGQLIIAAMRGDPGSEEAFNAALARTGETPGAIMTAAQQSWKTGTQQLLNHVSPSRAQEMHGASAFKAPVVVRALKERFDEIFEDFNRYIETFYRKPFNNMLASRLGDRHRE